MEDGVSGFLVPAGDPDALADRIGEALQSEDRLRDMGMQGRQRVHDHFTFAAQARQYRRLFRELNGAAGVGRRRPGKTAAGRRDGFRGHRTIFIQPTPMTCKP